MIYTLTLNPAVDRELKVPAIEFDTVLRASASRVDFGGKGFNISRLLKHMGTDSTALGFVGGHAGQLLEEGLRSLGIRTDFVWVEGETRTNVSIVTAARQRYIKVNEAGPAIDAIQQEALLRKVESLVQEGDWWALAGSLPPGVGLDFYARVVTVIVSRGGRAVVDTGGDPLRLACAEGPYLVKPNLEEIRTLTGLRAETPSAIAEAADHVRRMGACNVAVSMGKAGALIMTREGTWLAHSPEIEEKNPIGAGDAMVGGMIWALSRGSLMKEALGWGVASGAATASLRGTEVGSRPLIEQLFSKVHYEELS